MDTEVSTHDLFAAQWCPHESYYDLLLSTLRSRGVDEAELAQFTYHGRHPNRAVTSEFPLSDEARSLYAVATGSKLVTWNQAVRWIEDQGRSEEAVMFTSLYSFAWARPAAPSIPVVRFNPQVRAMEAHDTLYDLAEIARLITPNKYRAPVEDTATSAG